MACANEHGQRIMWSSVVQCAVAFAQRTFIHYHISVLSCTLHTLALRSRRARIRGKLPHHAAMYLKNQGQQRQCMMCAAFMQERHHRAARALHPGGGQRGVATLQFIKEPAHAWCEQGAKQRKTARAIHISTCVHSTQTRGKVCVIAYDISAIMRNHFAMPQAA